MPAIVRQMNELIDKINPGAMQHLGSLLGLLEQMLEGCAEQPMDALEPLQVLGQNLKRLTEDIIMEQVADSGQAIQALRQGIVLAGEMAAGQVNPDDWSKFQMLQMRLAITQGEEDELPPARPLNAEDARLAEDFIDEASEHLAGIEAAMLALEKRPHDEKLLNAVFRPFHTIKGVSGFLNFSDINQLSHNLENVLDMARQGKLLINRFMVDVVLQGVALLERMLANISSALSRKQLPQPLAVEHFQDTLQQAIKRCRKSPSRLRLGEVVLYKNLVSAKCVAQALVAQKTSYPDKPLGQVLVLMGFLQPAQLEKALGMQQDEVVLDFPRRQVKVEADKIDSLMSSLDELVKLQDNFSNEGSMQQRAGQLLQNALAAALAMARVPIGPTFNKMNRLVRDLAAKQDKRVRLSIKGQEVEVNRSLAEAIYEPLVHMVRNSLDHGIETPQLRRQNNKPVMGVITLEAALLDNGLKISVSDDGRGLDREKIKAKLGQKAARFSDEQLFASLFDPGFSTAGQISDISGRGVGLDVVKKAIEQQQGSIKVSSTPGRGTRFDFYFANPAGQGRAQ